MNWWKKLIRFKDWKLENKFLMLAVMFTLAFTALLPINRIPDEMNHARMSWGVLHEEKKESFNWMKSVGIEANISPASYRELFATKIDLSSESFKPRLSLKSISFLPQIMGMMLGQIIYPSVGVIVMFGRLFNAIFYIVSVYFLLKYFKFGKRILFFVSLLLRAVGVGEHVQGVHDGQHAQDLHVDVGFGDLAGGDGGAAGWRSSIRRSWA